MGSVRSFDELGSHVDEFFKLYKTREENFDKHSRLSYNPISIFIGASDSGMLHFFSKRENFAFLRLLVSCKFKMPTNVFNLQCVV